MWYNMFRALGVLDMLYSSECVHVTYIHVNDISVPLEYSILFHSMTLDRRNEAL